MTEEQMPRAASDNSASETTSEKPTQELPPDESITETKADEPTPPTPDEPLPPLRIVHTSTFPQILKQLKGSLLVSTYQAGRLVVLRADGDLLNTHFRMFNKPMGLALDGGRFGIGTGIEIWEFHNVPAASALSAASAARRRCHRIHALFPNQSAFTA